MNRREMLGSLSAGMWAPAFLSQAASPVEASRHTIDGFEAFRVKVNQRGDWVLLRTKTSSGLTGLGDCSQSGDDPKVLALLDEYRRQLRGRSIFAVEELRQWSRPQIAKHGRPAAVALSAVEQSLWDVQGQVLGVPTYQLFGGKLRSSVRQYANINRMTIDRSPAGFARSAELAVAAGFDAVKMAPFDGIPAGPPDARSRQIRLTDPPESFTKGHLSVSERPGFGITLNEKIVRQFQR
jgi:galactonate dehydratase